MLLAVGGGRDTSGLVGLVELTVAAVSTVLLGDQQD